MNDTHSATQSHAESDFLDTPQWDAQGLIPVIAQEKGSKDILMFAWMNRQALEQTVALGRAVYYSRSRQKLWHKGEESGHIQIVHSIRLDCDKDVILLEITQQGHSPSIACHTGRHSCFFYKLDSVNITSSQEALQKSLQWRSVEPILKDPTQIYSS